MRRLRIPTALAVSAVVLAGCSAEEPRPDPSGTPTPSASASGTGEGVTADAVYQDIPVHLEVEPVQVADDVALVRVAYSLGEDAPDDAELALGLALKTATGPNGIDAVRLLDLDAATVLLPGRDDTNQPAVTRDGLLLSGDDTVYSEGFYPAPSSDTVSVLFPYFGLVTDVPVVASEDPLPITPADLGREGEITYASAPVDVFTQSLDDSSAARVTEDQATVTLAADVLFATDEFALTAEAQAVIDAAAAEIAAVGEEGTVTVVGHTDDVGTDDHNQTLSEQRATSVAERLGPALPGFTLSTEGRGESQPAVSGQSAEARAANRRVEITFTVTRPGAAISLEQESGDALPEATGPEATGSDAVTVPRDGDDVQVSAEVSRVGAYLVGSLTVERDTPGEVALLELFGTYSQGLSAGRGLSNTTLVAGAHNATLLADGTRFYPADYLRPGQDEGSDLRSTLADQFLSVRLDEGDRITATVVWPDPGGDTVTIDVPDRFRLTDVPVD